MISEDFQFLIGQTLPLMVLMCVISCFAKGCSSRRAKESVTKDTDSIQRQGDLVGEPAPADDATSVEFICRSSCFQSWMTDFASCLFMIRSEKVRVLIDWSEHPFNMRISKFDDRNSNLTFSLNNVLVSQEYDSHLQLRDRYNKEMTLDIFFDNSKQKKEFLVCFKKRQAEEYFKRIGFDPVKGFQSPMVLMCEISCFAKGCSSRRAKESVTKDTGSIQRQGELVDEPAPADDATSVEFICRSSCFQSWMTDFASCLFMIRSEKVRVLIDWSEHPFNMRISKFDDRNSNLTFSFNNVLVTQVYDTHLQLRDRDNKKMTFDIFFDNSKQKEEFLVCFMKCQAEDSFKRASFVPDEGFQYN